MGMFKRGFEAAREEKERQDEVRESFGKKLWRFFLSKDGEEASVRFLTEEPINFYEHTIRTTRNGKESYDSKICTGDDCDLCADGDKASFKGAFLIYDKRPYNFKDKNGKKKEGKGQLRLYVQGTRVLAQLDRLSERYGLTNRDYIITRSGKGTDTTYMFDRGDSSSKLTEEEITNMLPEKLRDEYDGTQESLYAIVQEQLEMSISGHSSNSQDDDDDDDDDDSDNLVDIEDEEPPREPAKKPAKSMFHAKRKPQENSVKDHYIKK